jgi:hypothetical protein
MWPDNSSDYILLCNVTHMPKPDIKTAVDMMVEHERREGALVRMGVPQGRQAGKIHLAEPTRAARPEG